MRNLLYIFDQETKKVFPVDNQAEWALSFEFRKIKLTAISNNVEVSTVFLGIDHNFIGTGEPVLFETMIFGGSRDLETRRYTSYQDAVAGHDEIVASFSQRCEHCNTLRTIGEVKCASCGANF